MSSRPKPSSSSNPAARNAAGAERRPEFYVRSQFTNTLPDIPYDGKFLSCSFLPLHRFVEYRGSTLETEYNYELQCEQDMGIDIDLVDPSTYAPTGNNVMDVKDQMILEDDGNSTTGARRSIQHSRVVPWMRKTNYISSEFNRFGSQVERAETKVGANFKRGAEAPVIHRDRQSQIDAINQTFIDAQVPVKKHYSKKGVEAVEEYHILPDMELWKHTFAQVLFDTDPSSNEVPEGLRQLALKDCMIHGMDDPTGQQYIGCFSPSVETLQKKLEDKENTELSFDPEYTYTYSLHREYDYTLKNKATKGYEQECFFFYLKDGKMHFQELETRLKLNRRRRPAGQNKPKTFLHIKYHEPTEDEIANMEQRLQQMLQPTEEEDEEDEEEKGEEGSGRSGDEKDDSDKESDGEKSNASNNSDREKSERSSSSSESESD